MTIRRVQPELLKLTADVPQDKHFWCYDGRAFGNIRELGSALSGMSPETWQHHTSQSHNDFANWVRDVMGDDKLAADLQKATAPEAAAKAIGSRIAQLQKRRHVA